MEAGAQMIGTSAADITPMDFEQDLRRVLVEEEEQKLKEKNKARK